MAESYDFLFKFLVIGNAGTGKSCLLHQFIENKFKSESSHTIGGKPGEVEKDTSSPGMTLALFGGDPEKLCAAIAQRVQHKYTNAMDIYRLAMQRELLPPRTTAAEDVATNGNGRMICPLEGLYSSLSFASIRVGRVDAVFELLRDMQKLRVPISADFLYALVRMCTGKRLFAEALQVRECCLDETEHISEKGFWSCLLFCAADASAENQDASATFFDRIRALGVPSPKDFWNLIRVAAARVDWQGALRIMREMREAGHKPDAVVWNTVLAACIQGKQLDQAERLLGEMEAPEDEEGGAPGVADVVTYNTLMKGYAQAGCVEKCFALHEKLRIRKIEASQVTFGILLDTCINQNALDKATQVFERMIESGCQMNTVLYTTLIKGFARANRVNQAMEVYEQMKTRAGEVSPDLVTYSILIKANCDASRMETSLQLLEDMVSKGFEPDEIVYNTLLAGCSRTANGGARLARRLFEDMRNRKVSTSMATFSILVKVLGKGNTLGEALEILEQMPKVYGLDPEPRLYVQLAQACIRERQGKRALEVYKLLLCSSWNSRPGPLDTVLGNVVTACVTFNMYETALQILEETEARKGHMDARDANNLLEAMLKKKKDRFASGVLEVMTRNGLEVAPRLRPLVVRLSKSESKAAELAQD